MTLWDSEGGKWCPRGGESLIFSMVFYDSLIIHHLGFLGVITPPEISLIKLIHLIPTKCLDHSLKLTAILPLKIDGRKMKIPFRDGLCSGAMSVSGRVILFMYLDLFLCDYFRILPRYSSPCFTTIWENMFYLFQASQANLSVF